MSHRLVFRHYELREFHTHVHPRRCAKLVLYPGGENYQPSFHRMRVYTTSHSVGPNSRPRTTNGTTAELCQILSLSRPGRIEEIACQAAVWGPFLRAVDESVIQHLLSAINFYRKRPQSAMGTSILASVHGRRRKKPPPRYLEVTRCTIESNPTGAE